MQNIFITNHIASQNSVYSSSGNGLLPVLRQAITWTNADVLSIRATEQILIKLDPNTSWKYCTGET